jgi:hypothetical protein
MDGEYIKELNSIFYGFLLKLTLSEKKNAVCIFLQAHEATSTEKMKERNNKKFHNIPIALWMRRSIYKQHIHTQELFLTLLKGIMG